MKMQSGSDYQVKLSESASASGLPQMREAFSKLSSSVAEQMAANMKQEQQLIHRFSTELEKLLPNKKIGKVKQNSQAFLAAHVNAETEAADIRSENKRIGKLLKKEQKAFADELGIDIDGVAELGKKIVDTMSSGNSAKTSTLNKNSLSGDQLKKYSGLYNSGHFDTPSPNDGDGSDLDIAVYQAPFDGSGYRWSFSAAGSNFYIDEATNRIYDAQLGLTANQIAISLGVDSDTDTTHFTAENVSLLLINHPMKATGYIRIVGFMQCVADADDVKILDHSQMFTWFGNVGLGSSETTDTHALYVDIAGENMGKTQFFQQDYIPHDTDDHDYSGYDSYVPSELKSVGVALPVEFSAGETIPIWVGTGTNSTSHAVGQEIRTNTFQSWKLQEVWVITESSYNP
jgi:hypothetical protein